MMQFVSSPGLKVVAGRAFGPILSYPAVKHTATVIMLHGLGDTGNGWASVAPELNLDYVKWIFPTAPSRSVTVNMGMSMPAWFDIDHLDNEAFNGMLQGDRPGFDPEGVRESLEYVHALIARELDLGIPANRIIIGGFSQGGHIALKAAMKSREQLGGCIALSTWLEADKNMQISQKNLHIPIFFGHGSADPLIPLPVANATNHILQNLGCKSVEFKIYPGMQHSACAEELQDLKRFLNSVIPSCTTTLNEDDIRNMSVKRLKAFIEGRGSSTTGLLEKEDLIQAALNCL